jgi:hypothetical protein
MWRIVAARERWTERLARKIAWRLPRRVVMWCYVRVGAYATTGEYSDTVVPDLSMMDALGRWESSDVSNQKTKGTLRCHH